MARGVNDAPPRRLPPRRAAAISGAGRALVAAVPAFVLVFHSAGGGLEMRCATAAAQAVVWAASIGFAHAIGQAGLTALGPRIAVGRGVLFAVVNSTAASVALPPEHHAATTTLVIAVLVFVGEAAWETFVLRYIAPNVRLLLVGTSGAAETLFDDMQRGRSGGYELVGVVVEPGSPAVSDPQIPLRGEIDDLARVIDELRPDLVVLAPGLKSPHTLGRLLDAAQAGFRVVQLAEFYEHAFGRVPVADLPEDWFISVLHLYQRPYLRFVKRTIDIVGASILIGLTLPLFPVLALLTRQTGGSPIFKQVRLGEHGRLFTVFKFRTMYADAEQSGEAVWSSAGDPRVTPAGAFMRRARLDELPQLWNILRGDMSLVGPRPERPEFRQVLSAEVPFWTRRHLVKPGLTGWAQVRQGYVNSSDGTSTKLSYDLWYVRHRSLTVDLAILLRTAFVIMRGEGAAPAAVTAASRQLAESRR
jgi:exopolysaccharide biosynthesis polyprenyl glycosylphosphotransferase